MKPEVVFGLENAAWPALLVNAGGAVLRANTRRRSKRFGAALAGEMPAVAAIWSPENGGMRGGIFRALGEIAGADGGFEISRGGGTTKNEIHRGAAPSTEGEQMVCAAIAARRRKSAAAGPCPAESSRRRRGNQNGGRGAEAKTGLRAATGADGVAGFQQRADEHSRRTRRCCWARPRRDIRGGIR
jgi:hypothetical protein